MTGIIEFDLDEQYREYIRLLEDSGIAFSTKTKPFEKPIIVEYDNSTLKPSIAMLKISNGIMRKTNLILDEMIGLKGIKSLNKST